MRKQRLLGLALLLISAAMTTMFDLVLTAGSMNGPAIAEARAELKEGGFLGGNTD